MNKLCKECGKEFQLSKFNPYFEYCKEHRKGKKVGKSIKTKRKELNRKLRKEGLKCKDCEDILHKHEMGLFICSKCNNHYWVYGDGYYRTWGTEIKYYFEGNFIGKYSDPVSTKKMLEDYKNAR